MRTHLAVRLWIGQRLSKQASAKDDDGALMTLSPACSLSPIISFYLSPFLCVSLAVQRRLIRTADFALLPWQLKAATISLNLLDGMPKI